MKLSIWLGEKIVSSDFGVAADIWCWGCHALSARSRLKRCICRLAWLGSADLHAWGLQTRSPGCGDPHTGCKPSRLGFADLLVVCRPSHLWSVDPLPWICRTVRLGLQNYALGADSHAWVSCVAGSADPA